MTDMSPISGRPLESESFAASRTPKGKAKVPREAIPAATILLEPHYSRGVCDCWLKTKDGATIKVQISAQQLELVTGRSKGIRVKEKGTGRICYVDKNQLANAIVKLFEKSDKAAVHAIKGRSDAQLKIQAQRCVNQAVEGSAEKTLGSISCQALQDYVDTLTQAGPKASPLVQAGTVKKVVAEPKAPFPPMSKAPLMSIDTSEEMEAPPPAPPMTPIKAAAQKAPSGLKDATEEMEAPFAAPPMSPVNKGKKRPLSPTLEREISTPKRAKHPHEDVRADRVGLGLGLELETQRSTEPSKATIKGFEALNKMEEALRDIYGSATTPKKIEHQIILNKAVRFMEQADKALDQIFHALHDEKDGAARLNLIAQYNDLYLRLSHLQDDMRRLPTTFPDAFKVHNTRHHEPGTGAKDFLEKFDLFSKRVDDLYHILHKDLATPTRIPVKGMSGEGGGVNPSYRTIGNDGKPKTLHKLISQEPLGGVVNSEDFKRRGAQADREIACSYLAQKSGLALNPLSFYLNVSNPQFAKDFRGQSEMQLGSSMAWLDGAQEISMIGTVGSGFDAFDKELLSQKYMGDPESYLVGMKGSDPLPPITIEGREKVFTVDQAKLIHKKAQAAVKDAVKNMSPVEIQGYMAFNLLVGGLDEANTGNTMFKNMQYYDPVTQEVAARPVVIPIDKGYTLPDLTQADWCEQFVWHNWPGAEKPFCPEVARKIMDFDPKDAIHGLRTVYDEASLSSKTERMLPEGSYCSLIATSVALKLAVEYNLPVKDIANKMNALMRSDVHNRYKAIKNKS